MIARHDTPARVRWHFPRCEVREANFNRARRARWHFLRCEVREANFNRARRARWHHYGYVLAVVLAGCDDANLDDLRAFVELAPADTVAEAVAVDDPRAGAAESTVIARNPFERASRSSAGVAQANGPDPTRTPEPLEQYPLGRLQMVGTLAGRGALYALVRDPNGQTHPMTTGDHLGRDHGRIVAVHSDRVELVELVTDGTGWRRRPRSLVMETGDPASSDGGGLRE